MEILSALIPLKPNLSEMVNFSLMGFAVVMFVLAVLSGVTAFIGIFFSLADKRGGGSGQGGSKIPAPAKSSKPAPTDKDFAVAAAVAMALPSISDDTELVAVLSAAAFSVIGEPCTVLKFREVNPDFTYSRQGRQEIFNSHVIIPARAR